MLVVFKTITSYKYLSIYILRIEHFCFSIIVQEGISKVTTILFARSFLYVVCQSIKLVPDFYEVFACKPFHFEIGECPYNSTQAINNLIDIGHLFLAINSCGNILLYIVFGKSFRNSLVQVIKSMNRNVMLAFWRNFM